MNHFVISFLLVCSIFCGIANSSATIKANESLRDPGFLISSDKRFKYGFFSPANSRFYYVGVMYNLPVMTVVWVANRDKPLNDSAGTVEISRDGNLVVLNGQKEVVWSSNHSTYAPNSTALLLDTGNLVLQDNSNGNFVWESFLHATDSFLEKMLLFTDSNTTNKNNILTSWRSPSDPAPGRFTLAIVPQEFPQVYAWKDGNPYWRSGPWNGLTFIGPPSKRPIYKQGLNIVHNHPGNITVSFSLNNYSGFMHIFLNSSGSFQKKEWSEEKGEWVEKWSTIDSQCDIYAMCGPFGSCNPQDRQICTCFPGFEPNFEDEWSAANWSGGCRRRTPLECEKNGSLGEPGKQDRFLKLDRVKIPDSFQWFPASESECLSQCLNNCSCIAYAYYAGIGCMMWNKSLIDVQKFSSGGVDLYIKLAHSDLGTKKDRTAVIAITLVLGLIAILACICFLRYRFRKSRGKKETNKLMLEETALKHNMGGFKLDKLPLLEFDMISNSTNKFDLTNKLGQGGFGPVFKGKLPNGQEIAVKRLSRSSNQGQDEFMNEVEVISKLQHRNLVRLLGCCVASEEKLLVYEYMPNKSLDAYIFDPHKRELLDWQTRVTIIEGICRGLLYLHRDSRLKIIHRDLKASNILLDEELNPKIADFGMARIFGRKEDQANTKHVVGTYGYMPPEYALHGIFSQKSDVYSFGVLLLEMVNGRRNTNFYIEEHVFLIEYAWKLWNEQKVVNLIDPVIWNPQTESEILRYVNVALLCVQEVAANRPSISTVLSMLSCEIVDLPRPKKPAFVQTMQRPLSDTRRSHQNPANCSVNDVTVTIVEGR